MTASPASARLTRLRGAMDAEGLDGALISSPENRVYLSGFAGSDGYLLIGRSGACIATDFRYVEQARLQAPDYDLLQLKSYSPSWLVEAASRMGLTKVGFEGSHLTYASYRGFVEFVAAASAAVELVSRAEMFESLRTQKDDQEVANIAEAARIAHASIESLRGTIEAGMTEREVAWRLECLLRERGSGPPPFETIVASGPNGALPHWAPSDRKIGEGEPIVIDFGATVLGYCCDVTRTAWCGHADDRLVRAHDIVLGAQRTAIELIREGMTGSEADGIGRAVLEEAGYAEFFGHGLGHGVGLKVHESPRLGPSSDVTLKNGMVFTIEPGVYLPGWGGVRIEDTVLMEGGRLRPLR